MKYLLSAWLSCIVIFGVVGTFGILRMCWGIACILALMPSCDFAAPWITSCCLHPQLDFLAVFFLSLPTGFSHFHSLAHGVFFSQCVNIASQDILLIICLLNILILLKKVLDFPHSHTQECCRNVFTNPLLSLNFPLFKCCLLLKPVKLDND